MNLERRAKYGGQGSTVVKSNKQLDINLDLRTLDTMCKCIMSDNQTIRRGQLINLRNLLSLIKPDNYINDIEKEKRIKFVLKGIEARIDFNLTDPYMIMSHINGSIIENSIVDLDEFAGLTSAEIAWLNNMVSEALKFTHAESNAEKFIDVCTRLKSADYGSKAEIVKEFEQAINEAQNDFRRAKNENQTEGIFSLRDGYFEDMLYDTYNTLNSPRRKLITGMQGMNELLGGGLENGRCYVFFGLPGEGKSTIILNMIYQIKKYNRDYRTKDPTKRPCVVLLTMENTVTESIERLFAMATGKEHMTDYNSDSVIRMMREDGELYLTDYSPIDIIIKFMPSNSIDTSYLYTLTEDLEDQGLEVIAMFQDYIGRIRSTERLSDTRLEYGMVVDEFKTYAEIKDIPIITVAQLNRDASKHIDEGRKTSQSDLVRLIGRSNISESMLILNNIDAGFLIAPETNKMGERYLGIQRIKIRYDAGPRDYLYIPFTDNTLKLKEDFGGVPCYKTTMNEEVMLCATDGPIQSQYQTNKIVDMGQVLQYNPQDSNIFSTTVVASTVPDISSLEADYSCNVTVKNKIGTDRNSPIFFYSEEALKRYQGA